MSASPKPAPKTEEPVNVVEFAQVLVNNRRAALDLTVDQVRELAAAVLILDQQVDDANRRVASMMLADTAPPPEPLRNRKPEIVQVPIFAGEDAELSAALDALVKARQRLEGERHTAGENIARQKFEKAAMAVCNHVTPKPRRRP